MCPVVRHPNAATAGSFLPSPLKSPGFDVGDPGRPSAQNPPNFPSPSAHPDHRSVGVVAWQELTEVGDEQVLASVLVDVGERHVIRMRNVRDHLQRALWIEMPQNTVPWYLRTIRSSLPSPSKSASCTLDTAGLSGASGTLSP